MSSAPPSLDPLSSRYASREMIAIWSANHRYGTWRRLWLTLAETQQELGLPISDGQLAELRNHLDTIDFAAVERYEKRLRHDVMAHVHAYGDQCPTARPIIHWGATSCYVTDNAELILMREALQLVARRTAATIDLLGRFAVEHRNLACLAYTHLQPAQPTTVGKRACLWLYDLVLDLQEIEHRLANLRARSTKGTTGTQASFLQIFDGDHDRVLALKQRVAERLGFAGSYAVTGQTYPRKVDTQILETLGGLGQSLHKWATDLRLLASFKEIEEPFEADQIGSSAMAYKRNPMRSERICSLARFAMNLPGNSSQTAATQWFERTLDDSANRRLTIPPAFMAIDAALMLAQNVASGLVVYPKVIARRLHEELPFMATESVLMAAVAAGGDRQDLHERIRQHSMAASAVVKQEGRPNDLLRRIGEDPVFRQIDMQSLTNPSAFVGRAPEQVDEFIAAHVAPIRQRYCSAETPSVEVSV
jgi:adenylosuccinate lyase